MIALRIAATTTKILFSAARSVLCHKPSSAPVPFSKFCFGQHKNLHTDDKTHLYLSKYYNVISFICQYIFNIILFKKEIPIWHLYNSAGQVMNGIVHLVNHLSCTVICSSHRSFVHRVNGNNHSDSKNRSYSKPQRKVTHLFSSLRFNINSIVSYLYFIYRIFLGSSKKAVIYIKICYFTCFKIKTKIFNLLWFSVV